jgi:uncharacterized protein YoxC
MSNDKLSQELTDGLNESTLQVSAMISDVDKIGENMTKTIDAVMDAFKGESEERQKLLIAFKNLSEMLRKCQQTNTPLSMESLSPIQQDITTLSRGPEKNTSDQLTRLERELTTAKATITQLQSQLNTILLKRDQLEGENKQLFELNNGYKEEINKQMSIFEHLSAILSQLKTKISNVWKKSTEHVDIYMYLPDTLLAEIRQDVLKNVDYKFIDDKDPLSAQKVLNIVNEKWLEKILSLKQDLTTVLENLKQANPSDESISTWTTYASKLDEFLTLWKTKSVSLVQTWINKRQKM